MPIERPEEQILDGVAAYIEAGIGAKLTTIESEAAGISLPDVRWHGVGAYAFQTLNRFPALLYYPETIGYEFLTTQSEEITMQIDGLLVIREPVKENAVRRLLRYVAAVRSLLDDDRCAGGVVDSISITEVRYFAEIPGAEDRRLAEIIMTAVKEVQR